MEKHKIILLSDGGFSTRVMYHALSKHFCIEKVIVEQSVSKKKLIKGRIKRLGFLPVFGQLLFQVGISPIISKLSINRKKEILEEYQLNDSPIPEDKILQVESVNHQKTKDFIKDFQPSIIVVNGTRIIAKKTIETCGKAKLINTHVGITPKYRGVHGGYWALANKDKENCGVTVHFIDEGIDTGEVILQDRISITKKDNFSTYPVIQTAVGTQLMIQTINNIISGKIKTFKPKLESKLWYHPTAWQYLYNWLFRGIK
jgi:methionyl-tRNA formyltransferase